jgi:YebC/PmpR family DNA-binding regulatory protein
MSGHNKWSTIKHKKGAVDAKRGKMFTKIIKEVTVAARTGGGDPEGNPRLRRAIDLAKANNMPADNITRAIKKGTGELEGVQYEELVYEGVGPGASLLLIAVATDNRNRTAAEVRKIFDKHQGQLGGAGSAAWAFDEKGVLSLPKTLATEEQLFEIAVGAGAEDIEAVDDQWVVTTPREAIDVVRDALSASGIAVTDAELQQIPKTPKVLSAQDSETLLSLIETLEDHDDVQKVFTDSEPADVES